MPRSRRNPNDSFYIEPRSGDRYPLDVPRWCADGPKPLLISPRPGISRDEIDRGIRSLWRYQASLPVEISKPISLGEGCTPLVQKQWDDFRPFFKLEWFNPTCSFKDRGTTVMLSYLRQLGIDAVLEDSSGNGGASVAAFGAAGGMRVKILAPAYTSPAKVAQVRAYGAEVQLVEGPREESQNEAIRQSSQIFYSSHNWQPFFLQGTKSIAYELWEGTAIAHPLLLKEMVHALKDTGGASVALTEDEIIAALKRLARLGLFVEPTSASVAAAFTKLTEHGFINGRESTVMLISGTGIKTASMIAELF
jgi:threonine synthase